MELTEKIAGFVTRTNFQDIPGEVIEVAKNAITDCIGVTIPGTREDASKIIQKYIQGIGGLPNATVIGTQIKTTGPFASLANGVAAHVLDLDDVNMVLIGHPSVVLMPTVLASGEISNANGKDVLLAYILGFEVMVKLASLINPDHYEHGWHSTSTFGVLGAAVAAAKIFKLNTNETRQAIGLATSMAGGVRRNFGTMTKSFHAGNAARGGLESAMLCGMGFSAHSQILDKSMGFVDIFGTKTQYNLASVADFLGNPYELISSGVDFKRYPCCGAVQSAVDAAIEIRKKSDFSDTDIESVECGENLLGPNILVYPFPKTPLEAKFSVEYGVCRALMDGRLGLEEFTDGKIKDKKLQDLLKKTRSFVHPDLQNVRPTEEDKTQRFPAIITVKLKDGTEFTERVDNAKGRWENPLSQEEVSEKYRLYAGMHLDEKQVESSLNFLNNLEDIKDISDLTDQLKA